MFGPTNTGSIFHTWASFFRKKGKAYPLSNTKSTWKLYEKPSIDLISSMLTTSDLCFYWPSNNDLRSVMHRHSLLFRLIESSFEKIILLVLVTLFDLLLPYISDDLQPCSLSNQMRYLLLFWNRSIQVKNKRNQQKILQTFQAVQRASIFDIIWQLVGFPNQKF